MSAPETTSAARPRGAAGPPCPSPLARRAVAAVLRAEGGLLAAALAADPADDGVAALDAGLPPEVAVAVAATREAELLHHAPEHASVVRTRDRDLALLAGDRLYALGLEELARAGRAGEVAVLSDLVAALARVHGPAAVAAGEGPGGPHDVAGSGAADAAAARGAEAWATATRALAGGDGAIEAAASLAAHARGAVSPGAAGAAAGD